MQVVAATYTAMVAMVGFAPVFGAYHMSTAIHYNEYIHNYYRYTFVITNVVRGRSNDKANSPMQIVRMARMSQLTAIARWYPAKVMSKMQNRHSRGKAIAIRKL